uniref:Coactosin-like protein n=1 Tax=Equus caballus TaxID=9796 RepID=A0A9L0RRM0_HORSE
MGGGGGAARPGSRRALGAPSEPPPRSEPAARSPQPAWLSPPPRPPALRASPPRSDPCGRPGVRSVLRAACPPCGPAAMATKIDKEACRAAYNLVRDDGSAVIWVTFKYDGSTIVPGEQGAEYQDFIQQCTDDIRLFAFVRFTTGDAMSKRSKFALITWIGENVSGLQRAKTGTDKTLVKEVVQSQVARGNLSAFSLGTAKGRVFLQEAAEAGRTDVSVMGWDGQLGVPSDSF